ncbi:hypothetical protein GCM10009647_087550 [Streptomyces sanglieri]
MTTVTVYVLVGRFVALPQLLVVDGEDIGVNRSRTLGLALLLATGIQLWITTQVRGYELQVLSAVVTIGLAVAAAGMLFRSLDEATGDG